MKFVPDDYEIDEQDSNADDRLEQCSGCRHPRQCLQWKYHFLDVLWISTDKRCRLHQAFGKKTVHYHSREQNAGELCMSTLLNRPSNLEDKPEYKSVYRQHQHWGQQRPQDSENRATVATQYFPPSQLLDDKAIGHQTGINTVGL